MSVHYITYEKFTLPYRIYGEGPEVLLAFHGYGQTGEDFAELASTLTGKYTVYAFDLFYHGEATSQEPDMPPADASIFAHLIEKLLWKDKKVKFSVLGYSLGGRVALCLTQKLPHRINELFLIAPDGLKREWHENFIANTYAGGTIYKRIIKKPDFFFGIVGFLSATGIIHQKLKQFIHQNMDTMEKRRNVYDTWRVFRNLRPDLSTIAHYINSKRIRVELIFGEHDRIIHPNLSKRLARRIKRNVNVHLLETGHQLLQKNEMISGIILRSHSENHTQK